MKHHSCSESTIKIRPFRVDERPDPRDWSDVELMTLPEAAALFWPNGPLTTTSLRTAVRNRQLEISEIAGKLLTCKAAIGRMSSCRVREAAQSRVTQTVAGMPRTVRERRQSRLGPSS